MKNIRLTLEYDGTRYLGWQRPGSKNNSKTISGRITDTLGRILEEKAELYCAVQTEPGVHARCQTVHFKTNSLLTPVQIQHALNQYLPQDIAVLAAEEVPERFHSSLNLCSLTYGYFIHTGAVLDPFRRKYMLHHPEPLDPAAMGDAARLLLGTHDFRCFSSGKSKKGTEKNIQDIQFRTSNTDELEILLTGTSFLRQMPGLLLGTLLEIGASSRPPECISAVLAGREAPGRPVPPHGLHLLETSYNSIPIT